MEDKLNLIRQIFESPAFRDQTKEEQQVVVNQIISTGEVSAKEVEYLYARMNTSWLEKLPYDLFLRFVLDSGLKGKDVINLCNSSSVLNDYCNRGLELQDGTVVDQYLFRLLLQRDRPGIPYEDFLPYGEVGENSEDPRTTYKEVVIDRIDDHGKLVWLLHDLSEISWDFSSDYISNTGINYPEHLENLLYRHHPEEYDLLEGLTIDSSQTIFTTNDLYLIRNFYYLMHAIVDEVVRLEHSGKTVKGIDFLYKWQETRNPSDIIDHIIKNNINLDLILDRIRENHGTINVGHNILQPILNVLPDNKSIIEIMKNYDKVYRDILNACRPRDYQELKLMIFEKLSNIVKGYSADLMNNGDEDNENLDLVSDNLNEIIHDLENGDYDYVIDYIIQIHYDILLGKLKVTDPL